MVCIKQVPKAEQLKIDPVKKTLIREGVESEINPSDLHALEMALQLKDKNGGSVVALSMGPPRFIQSLETAIAMGADEGILLSDRAPFLFTFLLGPPFWLTGHEYFLNPFCRRLALEVLNQFIHSIQELIHRTESRDIYGLDIMSHIGPVLPVIEFSDNMQSIGHSC